MSSSELDRTDWSRLAHAYGRANETPTHLGALLDGSATAREAGLGHLWSALVHQGSAFSATAPAASFVAGILSDARLVDPDLRASLLEFLAVVGGVFSRSGFDLSTLKKMAGARPLPLDSANDPSFYEDPGAADGEYARAILDCVRVAPMLLEAVRGQLDSDVAAVRAAAANAASRLAATVGSADEKRELAARLFTLARAAVRVGERCALVLSLGEAGAPPREFLDDPDPAVRVCAALAPGLASDEVANAVLVDALENAAHLDGWFSERPPQIHMHPRFSVVAALVERVKPFERIVKGAVAIAKMTTLHCVDLDWGRLLRAAFPEGDGVLRTEAQRLYLRALVEQDALWNPRNGNAHNRFREAGLRYDRAACRALLDKP